MFLLVATVTIYLAAAMVFAKVESRADARRATEQIAAETCRRAASTIRAREARMAIRWTDPARHR